MTPFIKIMTLTALLFPGVASAADEAPNADAARRAIEQKFMAAKPMDVTERDVVFLDVQAGTANGGAYPYQVTAIIRDYSPGYPANHFYGETCVGRLAGVRWRFIVIRNSFGEWQADGPVTLQSSEGRQCTPNPSEGVSSMPLAGLR